MTTHKPMSLEQVRDKLRKAGRFVIFQPCETEALFAEDLADAIDAYLSASKEAVAWQFRVKYQGGNSDWNWCCKETFAEMSKNPSVYDTRQVFTHPASSEDAKLDKPARVGAVTFGKGVPWSTVIGAAQRAYDAKPIPPETVQGMRESINAAMAAQHPSRDATIAASTQVEDPNA